MRAGTCNIKVKVEISSSFVLGIERSSVTEAFIPVVDVSAE